MKVSKGDIKPILIAVIEILGDAFALIDLLEKCCLISHREANAARKVLNELMAIVVDLAEFLADNRAMTEFGGVALTNDVDLSLESSATGSASVFFRR